MNSEHDRSYGPNPSAGEPGEAMELKFAGLKIERARREAAIEREPLLRVLRFMHMYGGGFAGGLAEVWLHADARNSDRLAAAFPELLEQYSRMMEGQPPCAA